MTPANNEQLQFLAKLDDELDVKVKTINKIEVYHLLAFRLIFGII